MLSVQDWLGSLTSPETADRLPVWGALGSSLALRVLSYLFLRWIPGHPFPPLVLPVAALYGYCFAYTSYISRSNKLGLSSDGAARTRATSAKPGSSASGAESSASGADAVQIITSGDKARIRRVDNVRIAVTKSDAPISPDRSHIETALATLLSGVPSARSGWWNMATASVNALLALMVLDLTLRAPIFYPSHDLSFTRVGYVDGHSAKILIREPDPKQLPVYVSYRPSADPGWTLADTIYWLSSDQDYTRPLTISNLRHSTAYQYSTSNGHTGHFSTAPPAGKMPKGASRFTFLTSSCIKPRFPYSPLSHPLHIPGLDHLSRALPRLRASFMLFLGDFIYIDVPLRLGSSAPTYRREYRQVYASPSWPAATLSLPWLHVIDDHEIANDWDRGLAPPYPAALDPWTLYHHSINPPPLAPNTTYYAFRHGPASFFLLDSRRYRTPEFALPPSHPEKSMLGQAQLAAVLSWLVQPEPEGVHWKILVSSIPFTRNWRVNAQDTWAGYLAERQVLLEAMWDAASSQRAYGVVVLSGDRHEFAATRFPAPEENEAMRLARTFGTGEKRWAPGAVVHEFSCSPLSMFYLPVRSYWEVEGEASGVGVGGEDQCVAYIPDGNSKFGAVEIENAVGSRQSALRYRLFVDGEERWSHLVTSGETKGGARDAIWG